MRRLEAIPLVILAGCASGMIDGGGPTPVAPLETPILSSVSPGEVALGDEVTVIGKQFPAPDAASLSLHLTGAYVDSDGKSQDFDGEIPLDLDNASIARFRLDEIYFSTTFDKIGVWKGKAELVARPLQATGEDGTVRSTSIAMGLRVLPSIKIDRLRAVDHGCAEVTKATNANSPIELRVRGLGIGEATTDSPWTVNLTYQAPALAVRYVVPGAYDFWPPPPVWISQHDQVVANAPDGNNKMSFTLTAGSTLEIDPSRTESAVAVSPPVTLGQTQYDQLTILSMATGVVDHPGKNVANFIVEIVTKDGRTLHRTISYDYWNEYELGYFDGNEKLIRRDGAEATSGCIPGGMIGIELDYTEGKSVSKSRSVRISWNASTSSGVGASVGVNGGVSLGVDSTSANVGGQISSSANTSWSEAFGVDVDQSVSSEMHTSLNLQIHLLPSYYGMSYRQLEQLERHIDVKYHNACGASAVIGDAVLTNWNFGFDVAQDTTCPPKTDLPPAQDFGTGEN